MKHLRVGSGRRGLWFGIASVAALLSVTTAVQAEECLDVQSTSTEPDFTPCVDQEPQLDLDAALAEHASSSAPTARTDGVPWIAESRDLPATFNSSDSGVSVRTSLDTWRDYNVKTASPNMEQEPGFTTSTDALKLPKAPAVATTPIDVWSNVDLNGYDGSRDQSTRAGFGADYKFSKMTSFGISVEHGDSRSATTPGMEEDQKASAYVTLQAAPMLSLDARTEWQAGNGEFAASNGAAEKSAFVLAPKVNHSFTLDGGTTLEPFLTYTREFDWSARRETADPLLDPAQSAGAGVTYTNPDSYSLSVTADVDNVGATTEPQSLSSKLQLSVPIK